MKTHTVLKNIYKTLDTDIWVLGSGKSMDYICPEFFKNKITIATNRIWEKFPCNYVVFKHYQFIEDAIKSGKIVIASKHDCGDITKPLNPIEGDYYVFTHKKGRFEERELHFNENLNAIGQDDDIFVSWSSITSSIHLAAYMGARNIIVAGHDCCLLDGEAVGDGHEKKLPVETEEAYKLRYAEWLRQIQKESIRLREKIKEVYGCNIYTLNPFQVNGDIVPCCFDNNNNIVLGNLKKQSLNEIFSSDVYKKLKACHDSGNFKNSGFICTNCDQRNVKKDEALIYSSKYGADRINQTSTNYENLEDKGL